MIHDYSYSRRLVGGGRQKVAGKGPIRREARIWMWKTLGLVITSAMVLGVIASFWFGWNIRNGLDDLARHDEIRRKLVHLNTNLIARRDDLLVRERVEAVVKDMGLRTLSPDQIRWP